ncbi:MAG: 4-(cytidine 5'-diphospho)-2-C-methyl-D-erythritol kinase [Gemmatimonadota bacterium]|nr:MAG: 4-(cytidine 5'-diphospho)-2-C-methyl-D-erythritol kinase [Gemmatimonadota bacterium]
MASGWLETVAQAKVNLRLRIHPRGPDGFHPIETVFCRIDLADRLRLRRRHEPGVKLGVSGPERAPGGPENLAARAAALFLERAGLAGGVEIELEKRVPPRSGLGGGSSDAAAVLRLLSRSVESPPGLDELLHVAAELGADVPFFVADHPLAFAWGRGDRLLAYPAVPVRPVLLILPESAVSTTVAFALWDRAREDTGEASSVEPTLTHWPSLSTWQGIRAGAVNDFEPVIFREYPALGSLRAKLAETQPLFSLLSGSGAALFAVYESEQERDAAASQLAAELKGVRLVSARGPV